MILYDTLGFVVYLLTVTAGYLAIRWRQLTTTLKQLPIGTKYRITYK